MSGGKKADSSTSKNMKSLEADVIHVLAFWCGLGNKWILNLHQPWKGQVRVCLVFLVFFLSIYSYFYDMKHLLVTVRDLYPHNRVILL